MSCCQKCWRDAHCSADVAEEYFSLVEARRDNPCSPEEQAGPSATECPECKRYTVHEITSECMACGEWEERGWFARVEGKKP